MTYTIRVLQASGIIFFLLLFLSSGSIQAVTHYCQQNVIDTITDEVEGVIITRREGESLYGNNYKCSWMIDAGEYKKIKLTILSTDLQWAPTYTTCAGYDNLEIIEGQSNTGDVITGLCGSRNPYHVISQGRYLFLTFETTHQNFGEPTGVELQFEIYDNSTCPPGWFPSDETWCYSINPGRAEWLNSHTICSYSRANLASIISESDYQLIYGQGVNKSFSRAWIGLTDQGVEGGFKWIDKQKLTFQRQFSNSNPNDDRYNCVAQDFTTGDWVVERCDIDLNYICKAKRDGSTKLFKYVPSSDSPEPGGKQDKINFVIIIVVVVVVVIVGVLTVACIILKRRNPDMFRRKPKKSQKQELSTTRYPERNQDESIELSPSRRSPRPAATPSAPEPVMVFDTQLVAPPTYEESRYHPVAPSEY